MNDSPSFLAEMPTKASKLGWLIAGLGGGTGVTIAVIASKAVMSHPEFLQQLLNGGVLYFSVAIIAMVTLRNDFREFNKNQLRGVIANEELAKNVGALVTKDDQRMREQELTLNHLARKSEQIGSQNEEILKLLKEAKKPE